jgi:hypothetical protein
MMMMIMGHECKRETGESVGGEWGKERVLGAEEH